MKDDTVMPPRKLSRWVEVCGLDWNTVLLLLVLLDFFCFVSIVGMHREGEKVWIVCGKRGRMRGRRVRIRLPPDIKVLIELLHILSLFTSVLSTLVQLRKSMITHENILN